MGIIGQSAGLLFKIDADANGVKKELAAVDAAISSLGGKMSTFSGAATVAAAGIASIGAAGLAAGKFIFDLSKAAADYGSAIFDATEKTGLAAQTISSIKIAADQSGTSLETVTTGMARFAKTIGEAADGSDKAQEKLKRLGVTSTDLDTALGQALLTISRYPPGVAQMTAAQAAFGKSGAELLPFIKSFDGNLPALIEKCKKLGLTLTDEDARAADAFGDTLDTLSAQAAAAGRVFVGPMMRDITQAMSDMSGKLAKSQDDVKAWGENVAKTMRGLKNISTELYDFSQTPAGGALSMLLFGGPIAANRLIQGMAGQDPPQGGAPIPNLIPGYDPNKPKAGPTGFVESDEDRKAREDARKKAEAERKAAYEEALKQQTEFLRHQLQAAEMGLDQNQKEQDEWYEKNLDKQAIYQDTSIKNLQIYWDYARDIIDRQLALDLPGKSPGQRQNLEAAAQNARMALAMDVGQRRLAIENNVIKTVQKLDDERKKNSEDEKERIEDEDKARKKAFENELERSRTLMQERTEQQAAEIADITAVKYVMAPKEQQGPFDGWTKSWLTFLGAVEEGAPTLTSTMEEVGGILQNAFQGMANALGQVVQQWVLYGETGPGVMRKVLASALATIAAEAAVRAIYSAAMGFFFLATHQYTDATNAFISAAVFGSIAGVAAVAGRAVAGNAFKQQSSAGATAGTSTRSTSTQGGAYSGEGTMTINGGRNAPENVGGGAFVIRDKSGMFDSLFEMAWERNGRMRQTLRAEFAT